MNYVAFFDNENGQRITSYVEGIHFDENDKEEIIKAFEEENNCKALNMTDEEHQKIINGDYRLYKGNLVPANEIPLSEEEQEKIIVDKMNSLVNNSIQWTTEEKEKMLEMAIRRIEILEEKEERDEE